MLESIKSLFTQININFRILTFVLLSIGIIKSSLYFYELKTQEFKTQLYTNLNTTILHNTKLVMEDKQNASLMTALSIVPNPILIDIVFEKPFINMKLKELSSTIKQYTNYPDVWFSIVNEDGKTIRRSWTDIYPDKFYDKSHTDAIIKAQVPQPKSQFTINQFGLVINNMTPINYDKDLIGVFNVITHFSSITKELSKFNFRSVVFLDEKTSEQIDVKYSLSKKFIGNAYVVNKNADDLSMKIIFNRGVDFYTQFNDDYFVDENTNTFETIYKLRDINDKILGYMVLMHPLDEIDMGELEVNQEAHIYFTAFILFALAMMTYFTNSYSYIQNMKEENEQLTVENSTIQEKNDELDFNEKKIANMFHIQPNFMILSDGQSIENVNERMLWLLNVSNENGVAEIQSKYKCISDVFEESDDKEIDLKDYFYESKIEGKPWKDYILANFKRNYKTCIRDPFGKQHHFSIKINEMKYTRLAKRFIIISCIDITADIYAHRKIKEDLALAMEKTKSEQINSIYDKLHDPLDNITLAATNMKFQNSTKPVEEKEIDSIANEIISKTKVVRDTIKSFINKADV